ncbi:MAG: DUF1800 family protein [Pseudomonadota bacterium]
MLGPTNYPYRLRLAFSCAIALTLLLTGCGGEDSGGPTTGSGPIMMDGPSVSNGGAFDTSQSTARFLTQATFGPTPAQISNLTGTSASSWFAEQLMLEPTLVKPEFDAYVAITPEEDEDGEGELYFAAPSFAFWKQSIGARDQLRLRMAFALSQILVVSDTGGEILFDVPESMVGYQDILRSQAFGNYRDLLEAITFNPAMGEWLTYMGNQKADDTGRVPDENYARELLQLFTVGIVELQPNGEPRLQDGQPVELYNNQDVTGLARVFTGLDIAGLDRSVFPSLVDAVGEVDDLGENFLRPMTFNDALHSDREKSFLNCSIPAGTRTLDSITQALDCIMAHPNVGPFVSRQLIQRFTTGDPSPAYVERVATAFDTGSFVLPHGRRVGGGRKGDLPPTLAAILFDAEAQVDPALDNAQFGKIREPVLRFTNWARAFGVDGNKPEYALELADTSGPSALSQHPHRARSVFNFYRPGYTAPGTQSGALGMTVPELQIVNATSTTGYINFMSFWTFGGLDMLDQSEIEAELMELNIPFNSAEVARAWRPDYSAEAALANDATALLDRLNRVLAYGTLSSETRSSIESAVNQIPLDDDEDEDGRALRVQLAVFLVMTSPDYLVQR